MAHLGLVLSSERAASIVHERVFQRENFERTVMNGHRFLTATALGAGAGTSSVAIAGHWSVDAPENAHQAEGWSNV